LPRRDARPPSTTADREIVISRVISAPRELVFVVTHEKRDPWERPGDTTFNFVNDGIEPALDQAREAAGDRDVRIAGGGETILEYVNAGLIDEFSIALSPVLFGLGIRLFEGVDAGRVALEPVRAEPSPRVTHLTYAVRER
jgi:dihydrofolate reductase